MSDQLGSSRLQSLFETALQDYEKQTGTVLAKHPLAEQLQNCDSLESITAVFSEQTKAFKEFRGKDNVLSRSKGPYQFCISSLPLPILARILAWYVRRRRLGVQCL